MRTGFDEMTSVQPKTNHQATPSIHFCETFTGDLSNQVESPFAAVDDMSDYPLLCFSGPPGCGKRSFISKYARSRRLGCAHFQVVVEIFKKVPVLYPIKRNTAGSPPEEKSGAPEDEWPLDALLDDKLIADFVQSIVQNDPRIRFVVIENAHLLREAIFDFDWVCRQLSQLRCPLQFILMSSEKLPDALVSLCCRNRVALFSWFAPQTMPGGREIRGALRADLPLVEKPFPVMVSSDYEAMKAIVITLEADNADIINENSAFRDSMGYRISAGIFKRFSPTIRHFFLKTAFFSKMTNLMAEKLTGFANPESLLIQSCASSGHASDVSLPVKTYRYHPLLQKFLRQYAQEEYGETRISKEIAEVVKILIRNRMIEDVFSLLPDFVDFQLKCDCIINHASELMARNKVDLIEKALNSVPIKECLRNQRLGTWYGLVKLHKNPAGIGPFFNKLYCYFKKNNNIRWMCLSWIGAVDAVLLNLNQLGRLDGWIDEPITRLVLDGTFVPERWVSNRFLSGLLMALSLRKPTHPDLAQVYKKLIQADPYSDKNPAAVEILIRVIVYHMFAGDFSDLEIAMTDLVKKIKACAIPPVIRARAEYVRSLYLHYRGRFAKSRNGLKMAAAHAELSEESGIKEAISSLLVRGLIAGNEISSAQKYFNSQNSSYFASNSWENYHYFTMAMQIAAARKRLAKADTLGDNATIAADELGMPIYLITHKVDRVYLSVALEDYKKAHEQLIEAKRMAKGLTVSLLHLTIAFAEAYLNLSQSNRAVALDLLSSALRECRIRGLYGICMGPPKALENLCLASLEAGIEVEYVKSLIRRRKVKPDSPPVQIDDWPWPIKVYTLGRFAILNDNEKVIFPKKAKKKPLALLKATDILWRKGCTRRKYIGCALA